MTIMDVAMLLGLLGGTNMGMSWLGYRAGDAKRDVVLTLLIGLALVTIAGALFLIA